MRVHISAKWFLQVHGFNRFGAVSIFNAQKFKASRDLGHATFSKFFKGSGPDCPWKHVRQIWSP